MKPTIQSLAFHMILLITFIIGVPAQAKDDPLKSANVLAFGPDNVLFVGDSSTGAVYAFDTVAGQNDQQSSAYNLKNIDAELASLLRTSTDNIQVKDLAVHPESKEAYIAVSRVRGNRYMPEIIIANQSGELRRLDLAKTKHSKIQLGGLPSDDIVFWGRLPARSLTFTDIDYYDGKLYISGLSNADFASTLRIVPYPFDEDNVTVASVEIFHANHNQVETRAPIRTLEIVTLDGKPHLLAAYTCTPLVTVPLDQLKNGAHVRGKTIAELGYGNTPIDLIQYMAQDMEQNQYPVVMLTNKNQSAQVIALGEIESSNKEASLDTFAGFQFAGTQFTPVPMTGLMHIDDLDDYHILSLRRNMDDGSIGLLSIMKNLYFRLSDFEAEYDFPDYAYGTDGSQDFTKQVQNMLKQDEGFAADVKQ